MQLLAVAVTPVGAYSFRNHIFSIIFTLLLYAFKSFISSVAYSILVLKNAFHSAGAAGFEPAITDLEGQRPILARPRALMEYW